MSSRFLFIALFLFLVQTASSQISPLPNVGSEWTMASYGMFGINGLDPIVFSATELIEIDEQPYTHIGEGFFREENDQWFCMAENDSIEHLLYDFTLEEGDTLFFFNPFIDSTNISEESLRADYSLVQNTEFVELENGELAKKLNMLSHVIYEVGDTLMEEESILAGIGSAQNLFRFGYLGEELDDDRFELICFRNENNVLIYEDPVEGTFGTDSQPLIYEDCNWTVGLQELSSLIEIDLFPNPIQENLNVVLSQSPKKYLTIEIHNALGELVLRNSILTKNKVLNVSELETGIYVVILISDNEMKTIKKFIKI